MDLSLMPSASPSGRDLSPHLIEQLEKLLARRWVVLLFNLAVLVFLSASLAQWTWRLWQPVVPSVSSATTRPNGITAEFDLDALLAANLFGHAAPQAAGPVVLENIPPSSLNLVLSGVMVTPAGSFALISADGGPETPFAVGEEIVAGTSLYAVYADRALIRRGGATESLMLKDTGPALPGGSVVPPAAAPRAGSPGSPAVQRLGANTYSVNREQINQQLQRPEFLSQALMVPNAGGGFLVREVQAGSLYEKLGLKVGDVIQSVNGQPVNTVDDVMKLYQQFGAGGASQVSVDIRRAGKNESLQYNLQ